MSDSRRLESPTTTEAADRDSQAEALLVDGLDRYFAGQYDEAIHLWTRVLFLDRSHARARAYIDRARTALAERQRKGEEMLHATGELLSRGQTDEARDLLSRAVAASGDDEHAAALRLRLERVERARAAMSTSGPAAVADAVPVPSRRLSRVSLLTMGLVTVSVSLAAVVGSATVRDWLGVGSPLPVLPPVSRTARLPVLSSSEAALVRARTLYSRGRLAEALHALDRVDPDSANRSAADRLRVEIQQILLSTRKSTMPGVETNRGRP